MATKKRIPPRPTPPAPKPPLKPSQRKDGKAGPKPGSGGFGRAEDQLIRAASSYINTVGGGVRTVAGAASGLAGLAGKIVGSATSGGGPGAGSFASSKPAPKKNPGSPQDAAERAKGGKLAKVVPASEPSGRFEPRGDKRKKPTPRPVRGGGSKPKLPRAY